MPERFQAHLTVDKSIVELLSKSTYQRNFAYALREMVSNAYDADATKVTIDIDRNNDRIVIQDTGTGMSREDFGYYLRIAGKRRGRLRTPIFNRRRIGQFGVGFLSVFPFCKVIKIVTTTPDSDEILTAEIPAGDFFKRAETVDVESLPVNGFINRDAARKADHFTIITLAALTDAARAATSEAEATERARRSLGVAAWSPIERLKWELQDELPLAFPIGSPYLSCFKYPESEILQVSLNGKQLARNDLHGDLLDSGDLAVDGIKARFAISTPWKAIAPLEMRQIKIRSNNVGVGERTDFDIPRSRPYSRLSWLTGELHITEGLEDAIGVSRDKFLSTPSIEALFEQMAVKLRKQALHVEAIEEDRKIITKQVKSGKQKQVASTRAVVERSVKKLEEKGFVVTKVRPQSRQSAEAVQVDRTKKTVTIIEDHPSFDDQIVIGSQRHKLIYRDEKGPNDEPCVVTDDGSIVVYAKYPLFKSRRYGQVFERVCILAAVARQEEKTSDEMLRFFLDHIQELFSEYQ